MVRGGRAGLPALLTVSTPAPPSLLLLPRLAPPTVKYPLSAPVLSPPSSSSSPNPTSSLHTNMMRNVRRLSLLPLPAVPVLLLAGLLGVGHGGAAAEVPLQ